MTEDGGPRERGAANQTSEAEEVGGGSESGHRILQKAQGGVGVGLGWGWESPDPTQPPQSSAYRHCPIAQQHRVNCPMVSTNSPGGAR